jgi:antitoxin ParD1/3/4
MTVKTSISLTDQQEAFARSLVERGHYPSLSAVLQHGLEMLRAETERRDLDMEALRAALRKRAEGETLDEAETRAMMQRVIARVNEDNGV